MSLSNAPALAGSLPPGRYVVQLVAPRDAPPSGRFAVERVGVRNVDDPTQAEFAFCTPIDLVRRELRTNDRVHAMQRHRGAIRHMLRRVEAKGDTLLLYPMRPGTRPEGQTHQRGRRGRHGPGDRHVHAVSRMSLERGPPGRCGRAVLLVGRQGRGP